MRLLLLTFGFLVIVHGCSSKKPGVDSQTDVSVSDGVVADTVVSDVATEVDSTPDSADTSVPECGEISTLGRCDGQVLSYCENGVLKTLDCAAHGMKCRAWPEEYPKLYSSDVPTGAEPILVTEFICISITDDPCTASSCNGSFRTLCNDLSGALVKDDCARWGLSCVILDEPPHYADCRDPNAPAPQSCDPTTFAATCNGDVATFCGALHNTVEQFDCRTKMGLSCGALPEGGNGCVASNQTCDNIPGHGICYGHDLIECINGQYSRNTCGITDGCLWNDVLSKYDCVDLCDGKRAKDLKVVGETCASDGTVTLDFSWISPNFGQQRLEKTTLSSGFDANACTFSQTCTQHGVLGLYDTTASWPGLDAGTTYSFRMTAITYGTGSEPSNWCPGEPISYVTKTCP